MRGGAVLLLDEVDLASNKILCLQSILEGKGVYLKKTGKYITPSLLVSLLLLPPTPRVRVLMTVASSAPTCSTKHSLSVLPSPSSRSIPPLLLRQRSSARCVMMMSSSPAWLTGQTSSVRPFNDGGIDEIISTRRLVHIVNAYKIFGKRMKAIQSCVNRFDDETKESFLSLYEKIDDHVETTEEA